MLHIDESEIASRCLKDLPDSGHIEFDQKGSDLEPAITCHILER